MNFNFVARFLTSYSRPKVIQPNAPNTNRATPQKTNQKKIKIKTNWLQLWIFISAPGTNLLRFTIRKIVGTSQLLLWLQVRLLFFSLFFFLFWLNFLFLFSFIFVVVSFIPFLLFEISSHGELLDALQKLWGFVLGGDMCACMVRVQMRHAVNIEKRRTGGKKRRVCYAVALAIQPFVSPGGFGYL